MALSADERPHLDDQSSLTVLALPDLVRAATSLSSRAAPGPSAPASAARWGGIAAAVVRAAAERGWGHPAPAWAAETPRQRGRLARAHMPACHAAMHAFVQEGEAAALVLMAREGLRCTQDAVRRDAQTAPPMEGFFN